MNQKKAKAFQQVEIYQITLKTLEKKSWLTFSEADFFAKAAVFATRIKYCLFGMSSSLSKLCSFTRKVTLKQRCSSA